MRILIADDVEANRKLARATLQAEGYELVEVADGKAALDILETSTTPIVGLIDWEMPEISGVEVCQRARQRTDAPPMFLILLTVRDSKADVVTGLQEGAHDYVTKPFNYAELRARVRIAVDMVQLQQTLIDRAQELQDALTRVKLLSGLLPICSYCNRIKDGPNHWERVDTYVAAHSEANFSHGICPQCYEVTLGAELRQLKAEKEAASE